MSNAQQPQTLPGERFRDQRGYIWTYQGRWPSLNAKRTMKYTFVQNKRPQRWYFQSANLGTIRKRFPNFKGE